MLHRKKTAIYARLSKDDDIDQESNSIRNQKMMLEKYCIENGYYDYEFYSDDGYSGTNFDRPGFKKMYAEIESGNIERVVVKDMSRFGRNYILVGQYTELLFPMYGVQFIAVCDGVDTNKPDTGMMAFKNLINEMYARDISDKVRKVFRMKGENGKRLTTQVIYGYMKDPDDKDNWLVDDEAAKIVNTIFNMFVDGKGISEIARYLTENKVLSPSAKNGKIRKGSAAEVDPYIWSERTIAAILSHQEYCGDTVNFRTERVSYKCKKIIYNGSEDIMIFSNTHEAIITHEVFDKAQEKLSKKRKITPYAERPLLDGKVFCYDCKSKMYLMRSHSKKNCTNSFVCGKYRRKTVNCTAHYIRESILHDKVLAAINKAIERNLTEHKTFRSEIVSGIRAKQEVTANKAEKRMLEIEERIKEITKIKTALFEEKFKGLIPDTAFSSMMHKWEDEAVELQQEYESYKSIADELDEALKGVDLFFRLIGAYSQPQELSSDLVNHLIDRIEIHEGIPVKGSRLKEYKADIYFIGAGLLEL